MRLNITQREWIVIRQLTKLHHWNNSKGVVSLTNNEWEKVDGNQVGRDYDTFVATGWRTNYVRFSNNVLTTRSSSLSAVKPMANNVKDSNVNKPTANNKEENVLPTSKHNVSNPIFDNPDFCVKRASTSPNIDANAGPEQHTPDMDQS